MKNLCIYHKNCADGFGAALAVKQYYDKQGIPEEDRQFLAAQYSDVPPAVDKDTSILIVDFSYPRDVLLKLEADAGLIRLIDHHKTAQEEVGDLDFCYFDQSQSGAMLAWNMLVARAGRPKLIDYIQDRDLWTWELPDSKAVSAALQTIPMTFEHWEPYLNDNEIAALKLKGEAILDYQHHHIDRVTNAALPMVMFFGHLVPCINTTTLRDEIGNEISKGHPFAMLYFERENKRIYSLRSAKDGIDVSEIAKAMGGGGHFHAAAFSIDKNHVLVNCFDPAPDGMPSAFEFDEAADFQMELSGDAKSVTSKSMFAGDFYVNHYLHH